MNDALLVAAALAGLLGGAHSVVGERLLIGPLLRQQEFPRLLGSEALARRTLRVAWHLLTVIWWGIAAMLVLAARPPAVLCIPHFSTAGCEAPALPLSELGSVVAITAWVSAALGMLGTRGRHPAWILFMLVGFLVWQGTR